MNAARVTVVDTADTFWTWCNGADPGDWCEYASTVSVYVNTGRKTTDTPTPRVIYEKTGPATAAADAYDLGLVQLMQARTNKSSPFSYLAQRRPYGAVPPALLTNTQAPRAGSKKPTPITARRPSHPIMASPFVPPFYEGPKIADSGICNELDLMTHEGAGRLASIIERAWRSVGRKNVQAWVSFAGSTAPAKRRDEGKPTETRQYVVRTNLVNGLPPPA